MAFLPSKQVYCLHSSAKSVHNSRKKQLHCKNIWVTSTIFWSSQLHVCCVRDTLQTSRDASNLVESLSVVETLLFVKLGSSCRKLFGYITITMQSRNSSRGGCVQTNTKYLPEMLIYRLLQDDSNITKGRSF